MRNLLQNQRKDVVCFFTIALAIAAFLLQPCKALNSLLQASPDSSTRASQSEVVTPPELAKSLDISLPSRGTHSLEINLQPSQRVRLTIDCLGMDSYLTCYAPNGQKISELACRQSGPTPVTLVAETQGKYRFALERRRLDPTQGRCRVEVIHVRAARISDKKCVLAERLANEAEKLRWDWKELSTRKAVRKYEEALVLWRSAGESSEEAFALRSIGELHHGLGSSLEALHYFHRALQISEVTKDLRGKIEALSDLGAAYLQLDASQKALNHLDNALALSRQIGDRRIEAKVLNSLGSAYHHRGDVSRSLDFCQQALALWRNLGDPRGQAVTLQSLGFTYSAIVDHEKALDSFNQALELWSAVADRRGQALTLLGLGKVHSLIGEKQRALNLYGQAKPLMDAMGDRYWQVGLVHGLASIYDELGEKRRALEYYQQALYLDRTVSSREGEAADLWKIGRVYFSLGNRTKALNCLQLALKAFIALKKEIGESIALRDIGAIYSSLGKQKEALEYLSRALGLNQKGGSKRQRATTLNDIGYVHWKLGDEQRALAYYQQALSLHREVSNSFGESQTLYNLAALERRRCNLAIARSHLEAALNVVESLRGKVISHELRSSYFASERHRYDFYIDLLMQMHRQNPEHEIAAAALQASERGRARSLLESLAESQAAIRQGVQPVLLQRESSLRRALNAKEDRRLKLFGGKAHEVALTAIDKEIVELTREYQELQAEIKADSPRYAALLQPQPLTLPQIQQQVVDEDSLLLEYALGDEHSYLWAVTPTTMTTHELPPRNEVEEAAHRVRELLTARQPKPRETPKQYMARISEADQQYWKEAAAFSLTLLGPVADQLATKRLLIVAEGALQYLPFGALPKPERESKGARAMETSAVERHAFTPLIVDHEIVNLPSASTLAVLRGEFRNREIPMKAVAVLADPVFEADDPRLGRRLTKNSNGTRTSPSSGGTGVRGRSASTPPSDTYSLHRALRDVGVSPDGLGIPRLLSSRKEAEDIIGMVAQGAGMKATDFEANRATATNPSLGQYRIVHFATHGLLNSEHPERSGLVLSLIDEQRQPQDGFLRLNDIYNLNLPADLVVLSACNTALGKEVRGEGLIGIVRGFMYAGAARVVASLWKVEDEATAELMKRFYQQMLQHGLKPAAALRAAQTDMRQQKRWSSPYYWAGFVLQGEWK